MISTFIKRKLYKLLGHTPATMPMVRYWKTGEAVSAKLIHDEAGRLVMQMEGEDEVFPGFPRGYLLFGKLSKLKHEIKNQIFNDSWRMLEDGVPTKLIAQKIKEKVLPNIFAILEDQKYDLVPENKLSPAVKEIHRAWTKVGRGLKLRDVLCHILQEDDAYRWRVQWLAGYFNPNAWYFFGNPVKAFQIALEWLEVAEVIGDMKERQRLLKRVLLALIEDEGFKRSFLAFYKEVDWKKVRLTKADKYFFRGKYFKVDLDKFEY